MSEGISKASDKLPNKILRLFGLIWYVPPEVGIREEKCPKHIGGSKNA